MPTGVKATSFLVYILHFLYIFCTFEKMFLTASCSVMRFCRHEKLRLLLSVKNAAARRVLLLFFNIICLVWPDEGRLTDSLALVVFSSAHLIYWDLLDLNIVP